MRLSMDRSQSPNRTPGETIASESFGANATGVRHGITSTFSISRGDGIFGGLLLTTYSLPNPSHAASRCSINILKPSCAIRRRRSSMRRGMSFSRMKTTSTSGKPVR
ncbi:hypothetical protein COMA2_10291 [Candidatus Nitrospira nitrificans]|uniref:Uncharacterized protein n=1 Tax=Candidatus Nitrospira nitrificans TaxID=1742973 RepID=A0A0S4L2G9_9BACT|nr:hypothetical protein COMA2_10291 [Candidatus Nitrospira nitrificans]